MNVRKQEGMMLIEALIAVVLLAIGLIGTVAMQARAVSALSDAGMRAEATIAADRLIGTMTTDLANLNAYALAEKATPGDALSAWYDETRKRIPGATIVVAVSAPVAGTSRRQVDISIGWQRRPGDPPNRHNITTYLSGAL
jgi:type IV pilus assembly protein PilV